MRSPTFSVITAVLNGAKTLQRTIDSITYQTFRDYEYIVIDGASTDGTVDLLRSCESSITLWESAPDNGLYEAFNKAVSLARGTWVAFLGADDTYYPDALERYHCAIARPENLHARFVSSRVELVKHGRVVRVVGRPWSWPTFERYMTVAHVGAMHHKSLFTQYGFFDTSYRICGDYEFLLRPRDCLRSAFIDHITAQMSIGGMSTRNIRLALKEQERAKRVTAGRHATICALERRSAYLKAYLTRLMPL